MRNMTRIALIAIILAGSVAIWAVTRQASPSSAAQASQEDIRKAAQSGRPYVVKMGSDTCQPCVAMNPVMDELAKEYAGKVGFYNVDVYKNSGLAQQYQVRLLPTILFFEPGGVIRDTREGYMSKADISMALQDLGLVK